MSFEQKRVQLPNGISLDIVDEGPVDAPVLIFLHGFPESHRTWRHQIAHFSDRYRCIAPDQRGYRGSSKPQAVELIYHRPGSSGVADPYNEVGSIAWKAWFGGKILNPNWIRAVVSLATNFR
jgi:pimeloyl-ACP methyl ester carboxylesterase